MKQPISKLTYRVRNWSEYNKNLCRRGSLDVWIEPKTLDAWYAVESKHGVGRPRRYSDTAIMTALLLAAVFHLPLRAAQGFLVSLVSKLDHQPVEIPNYSTLCRRRKSLTSFLEDTPISANALQLVVDSTGLKIFGEGEWKVRQHGYSKRRTWRKLHLAVDASTHVITAADVTENDVHDSAMLEPLLKQIPAPIASVAGDGAYDQRVCYAVLAKRDTVGIIPPRKNARIWQHGNSRAMRLSRDQALRRIRKVGRKQWKRESGYHQRSLAETAMFRMKTIFGDHLLSRIFENQRVEALLRCKALNIMTSLGMPESYAKAQ